MFRTTAFALALLVTASLGFAPAPVYRPRQGSLEDELKNLQGKWLLVSRMRGGLKMTKKDFELIAGVMRSLIHAEDRKLASEAFALELALVNPRFDRARFLKACGV